MFAWYFLPTSRKCEKSRWLSSPAPSHENTTNCGGLRPGASRCTAGCFGWAPVNAVEPSPMRRSALLGAASGAFFFAPAAPFATPGPDTGEPEPDPAHPAAPASSTRAMTPKAILFVAAIIRPPSSLQVACAGCRHGAVKVARTAQRSGRQAARKAAYSLEWVVEWTICP